MFLFLQIPAFHVPGFTDSGFSCSWFYRFRLFMFLVLQIPAFHVPGFLVPRSVPCSVPRFPVPCFTDSQLQRSKPMIVNNYVTDGFLVFLNRNLKLNRKNRFRKNTKQTGKPPKPITPSCSSTLRSMHFTFEISSGASGMQSEERYPLL